MKGPVKDIVERALAFGEGMAKHEALRARQRQAIERTTAVLASPEWRDAPGVDPGAAALVGDAAGPLAFATEAVIAADPDLIGYYREQAGIPAKRFQQNVAGTKGAGTKERNRAAAQLVNEVVSAIVVARGGWQESYHERLAASTQAVSLDGTVRNRIGQDAEEKVAQKLVEWLMAKDLMVKEIRTKVFELRGGIALRFASEPDIGFYHGFVLERDKLIAVVEIKGGKDPAAALERIGAIEKSMNETPAECWRFVILGVTTTEMEKRLEKLNVRAHFDLEKLLNDEDGEWERFTNGVFRDALRLKYE